MRQNGYTHSYGYDIGITNISTTYQGWFLKIQCKFLSAGGISTNNVYVYASLSCASLQDCPWKLVSSDVFILFHYSLLTDQNVSLMAITWFSLCSHSVCWSWPFVKKPSGQSRSKQP